MLVNLNQHSKRQKISALVLGSFDGVHRGHQVLLSRALEASQKGQVAVLCFSPHPQEVLPSKEMEGFKRIFTEVANQDLLLGYGAHVLFQKKFTLGFSQISDVKFLNWLWGKVEFSSLVVGHDFKFGRGSSCSSQETLKRWCENKKLNLIQVSPVTDKQGKRISSTEIRHFLDLGDLKKTEDLLGHPIIYKGSVVRDQGLGSRISAPTLNLKFPKNMALKHGVYLSKVFYNETWKCGVSNFGRRPTVSEMDCDSTTLETHVIEKFEFLEPENQKIQVQLFKFLREEKKFDSLLKLKEQIQQDISLARRHFGLV